MACPPDQINRFETLGGSTSYPRVSFLIIASMLARYPLCWNLPEGKLQSDPYLRSIEINML